MGPSTRSQSMSLPESAEVGTNAPHLPPPAAPGSGEASGDAEDEAFGEAHALADEAPNEEVSHGKPSSSAS